jgi:hypothetical protein
MTVGHVGLCNGELLEGGRHAPPQQDAGSSARQEQQHKQNGMDCAARKFARTASPPLRQIRRRVFDRTKADGKDYYKNC